MVLAACSRIVRWRRQSLKLVRFRFRSDAEDPAAVGVGLIGERPEERTAVWLAMAPRLGSLERRERLEQSV